MNLNCVLETSVVFFRQGKSYYFKYNDQLSKKINSYTINKLKESLNVPFKVQFVGVSRVAIARIISNLLDNTMDVLIKRIKNNEDSLLRYEAIFVEQKKYVNAYKVLNKSNFYGRTLNCNPFLYIEINEKKVLIETTKDYAKNNTCDYYFIADELDEKEQEFFDKCYTELECDYIYRIDNQLNNKEVKPKRRKIKF